MPVRAYVIAVRPYHKRLADDLWFSADRYASVPEGTTIVVPVFESVSSHTTDRLAGRSVSASGTSRGMSCGPRPRTSSCCKRSLGGIGRRTSWPFGMRASGSTSCPCTREP